MGKDYLLHHRGGFKGEEEDEFCTLQDWRWEREKNNAS